MQTVLAKPAVDADGRLGAEPADEACELALLAQFMRYGSVDTLANAIAERLGESLRGGDLIAAAGLGPSRADS
jgi:hypothetical protein